MTKLIKNQKSKIKIGFILIIAVAVSTSCNFLNVDKYFDEEFKLDSTFTQTRYVEAYMWGIATLIPDEARVISWGNTPGPYATDEAIINIKDGNTVNGASFALGWITPDNLRELNTWGSYYKMIRIANTILNRMGEVPDMTPEKQRFIEGYTRFFRAYAYYHLLMNFGPPILLGDEVVNNNENIAYYDRARCTYDEAVKYICDEFEAAARYMPVAVSIMDFGRPARGAALALSARVRLIHASPAYNGGEAARRYFGSWLRKTDKAQYVSQTYDERRWAVAAAAAQRVMELQYQGRPMYSLYTVDDNSQTSPLPVVASDPDFNTKNFPEGALGIDHFRSYSEMFTGEAMAPNVREFIWARNSMEVSVNYTIGAFPTSIGGWGRYAVSHKMVDAYKMNDGRTIDEAKTDGYYSETGFLNRTVEFSDYKLLPSVSNMYVNREMRFYASVGFNQAFWECASVNDQPVPDGSGNKNHIANYYSGGWDGKGATTDPFGYAVTGYVVKKWINRLDALQGGQRGVQYKVYALIRHAEILLSYAEALNNLTTSHDVEIDGQMRTFYRDKEEIRKAFNQVRYRAGLPGITDAELNNPAKVQALIEHERMVEFMFENRRYFDVRRWGIYEQSESEPIRGLNTDVEESNREAFYQRILLGSSAIRGRIIDKKLMFVPIPRGELRRLPSLDQNPGWD